MKKIIFIASFAYSLTANFSFGQTKTRTYLTDPLLAPREHVVDFQHLKLEVSFEPQKSLVKGKVTHYFTPLRPKVDSIVLDAIRIDIKEVVLNGKPAKFKSDSATLTIYTPSLAWEQKDS